MSKITVLSQEISNLIAAGEVVERPSSVVKELIENAIDAQATYLVIEIENAGTKLIAITDNGCGMDEDDIELCLQPHGTSKIKTAADIEKIHTLGFRGEAIPSIASVSRMHVRSRTAENLSGLELKIEAGVIQSKAPIGCTVGTAFIVRDLFFNTPARRKFLRSASTEEGYIQEAVIQSLLPHPHIGFELFINRRKVLVSPSSNNLDSRLQSFFGKKYFEHLLQVDYNDGFIRISGFVATGDFTRSTRREQRTFINKRPVESQAIYRGIKDGYGALNDKGRYAPVVLFLEIPVEEFDINVHPAKREVRFRHEQQLTRSVAAAVRSALQQTPLPELSFKSGCNLNFVLKNAEVLYPLAAGRQTELFPETASYCASDSQTTIPNAISSREISFLTDGNAAAADLGTESLTNSLTAATAEESSANSSEELTENPETASDRPISVSTENAIVHSPITPPEPRPLESDRTRLNSVVDYLNKSNEVHQVDGYTMLGALDNTYLLAECNKSLLIIDQHAAHERVLYEQLLQAAQNHTVTSQHLLLPLTMEPGRSITAFVLKNKASFSQLGFEIEELSSNTLMISAIPGSLKSIDPCVLLSDIFENMFENIKNNSNILSTIASSACKAAVKAHDKLSFAEAQGLLKQLSQCERPDICPHGRPTMIKLSCSELERRFGRK